MAERNSEWEAEFKQWQKAGIEAWLMTERQATETNNRLFCPSGGDAAPTEPRPPRIPHD